MSNNYNITDYGARPGEKCTTAVQAAIDAASKANGTVIIPAGTFISGTLDLKGVSMYLEKGAVLQASPDIDDYREFGYIHNEMKRTLSLLYSVGHSGVSITGEGKIDLNGHSFFNYDERNVPESFPTLTDAQLHECTVKYERRPTQPIFFYKCNDIHISGITIMDAPCWTMSFNDCEDIRVSDLFILNDLAIPNDDGMHFCGCRRVNINRCTIVSGDDCIALSSITDWDLACEDVVISDCILTSCSKAIVLGYMHSIVRNILITNCIIRDSNRGLCIMSSSETGLVEHVIVNNLRIDTRVRAGNWWGNGEPICIFALQHDNSDYLRAAPDPRFNENIRAIRISNVICTGENICAIVGTGSNVRDVFINGISYTRKQPANVLLKGQNVIDVSPSNEFVKTSADTWMVISGAKNVQVTDYYAANEHGQPLYISEST